MFKTGTMGGALLLGGLGIALAGFLTVYIGDALIARYRIAYHKESELSVVTAYYSAALKNSKIVIFGGEPARLTCIHSLFPHFGYPPCRSVANKIIELD